MVSRLAWRHALLVLVVALTVIVGFGEAAAPARAAESARWRHGAPRRPANQATRRRPRPAVTSSGLTRSGAQLLLNGRPYRFTGVNAFGAATWWGVNWGCGSPIYDLDRLFAPLRPNSLVRFWAFQAQAWNNKVRPGRLDFTAMDRVIAAAEKRHQRLILTLSDQSGTCDDGHWHDQAWYDGGYRDRFNDDGRGLGAASYWTWVHLVVARYQASPAIGMWELVNEPEASDCEGATGSACFDPQRRRCPTGAATSLAKFFDTVGGEVHRLDPRHLVIEGVAGGGQCGLSGGDYEIVGGSKAVDVLTFHDYDGGSGLPGGLAQRLAQARQLRKPLVVEEAGLNGSASGQSCPNLSRRAASFADKIKAARQAGAAGYLPWWWVESPDGACHHEIGPGDPVLGVLHNVPL